MINKQMKKVAKEIYELEQQRSSSLSHEEQNNIENRIIDISNRIMSSKDGINSMLIIDTMIQELMEKNRLEKDKYGNNET